MSEPKDAPFRIVCELFGVDVTAKQAKLIEDAVRAAARIAFPDDQIRGLWVHKGVGS